MPFFRLFDRDRQSLLEQPETGMGFQLIRVFGNARNPYGLQAKQFMAFGERIV